MTKHAFAGWHIPKRGSLQWRVLAITLTGVALALVLSGVLLQNLFSSHIHRQFEAELGIHLEQLTARLEFDPLGRPLVDATQLSDPRWVKPFSGRYWQIESHPRAASNVPVLRSRSLWDEVLALPLDTVADGEIHVHRSLGPGGKPLMVLERTVLSPEQPRQSWTVVVAGDISETEIAIVGFTQVLGASLLGLLAALGLAAVAQVWVGLSPLRALQKAVMALDNGQTDRVLGQFPVEVQPLVEGLNRTLQRQEEGLAQARTQAGNLAHALKTPLAVLRHAADTAQQGDNLSAGESLANLSQQIHEQVNKAQTHIDWHLRRARSAAHAAANQHTGCALLPTLQALQRVMEKVHAQRQLHITLASTTTDLQSHVEQEDLHELLGNLVDNACKWARTQVHIHVDSMGNVTVEDDGPGIPETQRVKMLQRGERLDEATPGSGLGLAIVAELAALYGLRLTLGQSPMGGLSACLSGLKRER